jgi:hypothetical protein
MKLFLLLAVLVIGLRLLVFWARKGAAVDFLRRFKRLPKPHPTFVALRGQALRLARGQIGFLPAATATQPWGVIMDEGLDDRVSTVVALADGSASVYSSVGGGTIGGQEHEAIRDAAHDAVSSAAEIVAQAHQTSYFPLPKRGQIFFYIRTDAGVFTARVREKALRAGTAHALAKLRAAMRDVAAQYEAIGAARSEG